MRATLLLLGLVLLPSPACAEPLPLMPLCSRLKYEQPEMPTRFSGSCKSRENCYSDGYTLEGKPFFLRGNYTKCAPDCLVDDLTLIPKIYQEDHACWRVHCWTVFDCYETRQGAPIGYCRQNGSNPKKYGYGIGDVVVEEYVMCRPK